MIRIRNIDHIVLRTARMPAMVNFYCAVLNCVVERTLADLGLTQLRAGGALIDLVAVDSELGRAGGGAPQQAGRNVDHFCLLIEAVNEKEILDYLQANGIVTEPFAERYGATGFGRSIYIKDPEGNVLELKLAAV